MPLTAGLVGYGLSGRALQRPLLLAAGFRITAVVTQQRAAVAETLPGARVLPDLDALLAEPDLDLVVIATPHHLHAPQAEAALKAGRHVVVEKPLALTPQACDRLMELAAQRGRVLTVFHNRRWDSDFLTLRGLLDENALGTPLLFEAHWDRYRPEPPQRWRERIECGGGVLYDLGPHLLDQALLLFGRPEWLQADVYTQRTGAQADDAFSIRMGRGALRITLSASSVAADSALRYRLHGLRASFRKSGLDVQERQLRQGLSPTDAVYGLEPAAQWGELIEGSGAARRIEPSRGQWARFYEALRTSLLQGSAPPVIAAEARSVIELLAAARTSSDLGCRINL